MSSVFQITLFMCLCYLFSAIEGILFHPQRASALLNGIPNPQPERPTQNRLSGQGTIEPMNEICLGCICEASSGCNSSLKCEGETCGLFQITWPYWADAQKPTLKFDQPDNPEAYARCTTDPECAARAVTNYMSKFAQDCNNDGQVNCWDYAAIHKLGGYGCGGKLDAGYLKNFNNCQQQVSQILTGRSGNRT